METIVEFKNISKSFPGVQALSDISLAIDEGEVHALVGENGAGKSTLMHILGGQYQPDDGSVLYKGKPVEIPNQNAAIGLGIGFVYQELKLCPNLTVTENIFLGRERDPETGKVNWKKRRGDAAAVLEGLGAEIDPNEVVKRLSVAKRQLVEIAKAISLEASVIIMDEPTSSLTLKETENLFATIRNLKEKGVTIIYISHRLDEIFSISNRISVLRDGKYLGTYKTEAVTTQEIVSLIAGRELIDVLSKQRTGMGVEDEDRRVALEVRNLSRGDTVKDVSFSLYENEILGIYGLQGAGRTELLETIFGLASATEGKIYVFGERLGEKKPEQMIRRGVAMVPEDRRGAGIFPKMDVTENINMSNTESMKTSLGILKFKAMKETAGDYKKKLGIKAHLKNQILRNLSGGNQQKVVIAKWLATRPRILLVDELTRGIDVGAKAEIFKILQELRDEGLSILFVSSELPEIISESDRVLVMRNGQKTAVLSGEEITKEQIIHYALQG